MKLNVDQTLQQAINLHNSKKFEEAESLYREILKIEPTHPDANHNLGVLLVYLGKTAYALSLFKTNLSLAPISEL